MLRHLGGQFLAYSALAVLAAAQALQPDAVDGTSGRLRLVTDQQSPVRIQAATENPKTGRAWLSLRADVPEPIDAVTVTVIARNSSGPSVRTLKSGSVHVSLAGDDTFVVEMNLLDAKALDELPAGSTAEVGITKVTFANGKTWTWNVQVNGGFERLPPDSPLLHVRPFFEKDAAFLDAKPRPGCINPVPIHSVSPKYPPAAMEAKLQGDVELDVIVLADGSVGKVRVTSSLDRYFGLDREAVIAARQWKFKPGTCQGVPVDTAIGIGIKFRLH